MAGTVQENARRSGTDAVRRPIGARVASGALLLVGAGRCVQCAERIRVALAREPGLLRAAVDVDGIAEVWFDGERVTLDELTGIATQAGDDGAGSFRARPLGSAVTSRARQPWRI